MTLNLSLHVHRIVIIEFSTDGQLNLLQVGYIAGPYEPGYLFQIKIADQTQDPTVYICIETTEFTSSIILV